MAGVFLIQPGGALVEMTEAPYDSEAILQELLAHYPNLLTGDSTNEVATHRWLLVSREVSLLSQGGSSGTWSVDHLFLDEEAIPTLVEVKQSTNSEIRRSVVGQMLDYAANAVVYWPIEKLRATFEANCEKAGQDHEQAVAEHIGDPEGVEDFWQRAATNLQAQRIRLVFVADAIPSELRRVIEFLNGQMSPAEVLGIEVKQYTGQGLRTLVPRFVGRTAEAERRKNVRRDDWSWELYESELGILPVKLEVAKQLLERVTAAVEESGLPWKPVFRKGYIGVQRAGGYNVGLIDVWWRKVVRFAVKLPKSPTELDLTTPYPSLAENWDSSNREWGWMVPSVDDIPDVMMALDAARPFHPLSGPMVVP